MALETAVSGKAGETAAAPAAAEVLPRWRIRFFLPSDAMVHGAKPELLLAEIASSGPCRSSSSPTACRRWLTSTREASSRLGSGPEPRRSAAGARQCLHVPHRHRWNSPASPLMHLRRRRKAHNPKLRLRSKGTCSGGGENTRSAAASEAKQASSLRIPAERLDELMDRVGELVIAQARLSQLAAQSSDGNLKSVAEELERLSSGLRDTTMASAWCPSDLCLPFPAPRARSFARTGQGHRIHHHRRRDRTRQDDDRAPCRPAGASDPQCRRPWPRVGREALWRPESRSAAR